MEIRRNTSCALLLLLLLGASNAHSDSKSENHAQPDDSIFLQKLNRLVNLPGSSVDQSQPSWIIVDMPNDFTRYFLTSSKHDPAYPAIYKRSVNQHTGTISIKTTAQCYGNQEDCKTVLAEFEKQDLQIRQALMQAAKASAAQ